MAHGVNAMLKKIDGKTGVGSRRIFPPHFKLQVLDSYRNDADCKGNQRATARKYGIHRRQIQKWLQVENNLRNSVKGKEEVKKCDVALKNRLCAVDEVSSPPLPLDFTTRDRMVHASPSVASLPPSYPTSPIDLSLKRPQRTPVCSPPSPRSPPHSSSPPHHRHIFNNLVPEPDVWDLSTKTTRKRRSEDEPTPPPKPIKLFKPYLLDDIHDDTTRTSEENNTPNLPYNSTSHYDYYNNNNNNNNHATQNNNVYDTYTIQELHPKNSVIYYYPLYPLYPSPEPPYSTTPPYDNNDNPLLPKRQTYSLDFKLSAIDSYYQDEICRGNQRAVATKYNIHRRQVQKWLQQEDELRQRNDKQIHVIS